MYAEPLDPTEENPLDVRAAADELAETDRPRDPREVLDTVKRGTIVALVRLGASRRMVAREVGCSAGTITRTAARDPQFAARLAHAESLSDRRSLELISRAVEQEKYWRAAAWMLERRNPEEFGRRAPHTFTSEQVMGVVSRLVQVLLPAVPEDRRDEVMLEFNDTLAELAPAVSQQSPDQKGSLGDRNGGSDVLDDAEDGLSATRVEELRHANFEKTERWLRGLSEQRLREALDSASARGKLRGDAPADDRWSCYLAEELWRRVAKTEVTYPGGVRKTLETIWQEEDAAAKAEAALAQQSTPTSSPA